MGVVFLKKEFLFLLFLGSLFQGLRNAGFQVKEGGCWLRGGRGWWWFLGYFGFLLGFGIWIFNDLALWRRRGWTWRRRWRTAWLTRLWPISFRFLPWSTSLSLPIFLNLNLSLFLNQLLLNWHLILLHNTLMFLNLINLSFNSLLYLSWYSRHSITSLIHSFFGK